MKIVFKMDVRVYILFLYTLHKIFEKLYLYS